MSEREAKALVSDRNNWPRRQTRCQIKDGRKTSGKIDDSVNDTRRDTTSSTKKSFTLPVSKNNRFI